MCWGFEEPYYDTSSNNCNHNNINKIQVARYLTLFSWLIRFRDSDNISQSSQLPPSFPIRTASVSDLIITSSHTSVTKTGKLREMFRFISRPVYLSLSLSLSLWPSIEVLVTNFGSEWLCGTLARRKGKQIWREAALKDKLQVIPFPKL